VAKRRRYQASFGRDGAPPRHLVIEDPLDVQLFNGVARLEGGK
jgi:hypothetical protein